MNEAQLHKTSSFITLTYSDETLNARRTTWEPTVPYTPPSREERKSRRKNTTARTREPHAHADTLSIRDVQLFLKRLRKDLTTRKQSTRVRYYLVGEYGGQTGRPHYHIALFGEDFSDDRAIWRTSGKYTCYRSSRLETLWPHGNSEIGELTEESAVYTAGYIIDKMNGKKAMEHYRRDLPNGTTIWITPEFAIMSRRPGIGREFLTTYWNDVYPRDYVVINGNKARPPRYYDKLLEMFEPRTFEMLKIKRQAMAQELAGDNTPARLAVKETVTKAKMATKKRQLEDQ